MQAGGILKAVFGGGSQLMPSDVFRYAFCQIAQTTESKGDSKESLIDVRDPDSKGVIAVRFNFKDVEQSIVLLSPAPDDDKLTPGVNTGARALPDVLAHVRMLQQEDKKQNATYIIPLAESRGRQHWTVLVINRDDCRFYDPRSHVEEYNGLTQFFIHGYSSYVSSKPVDYSLEPLKEILKKSNPPFAFVEMGFDSFLKVQALTDDTHCGYYIGWFTGIIAAAIKSRESLDKALGEARKKVPSTSELQQDYVATNNSTVFKRHIKDNDKVYGALGFLTKADELTADQLDDADLDEDGPDPMEKEDVARILPGASDATEARSKEPAQDEKKVESKAVSLLPPKKSSVALAAASTFVCEQLAPVAVLPVEGLEKKRVTSSRRKRPTLKELVVDGNKKSTPAATLGVVKPREEKKIDEDVSIVEIRQYHEQKASELPGQQMALTLRRQQKEYEALQRKWQRQLQSEQAQARQNVLRSRHQEEAARRRDVISCCAIIGGILMILAAVVFPHVFATLLGSAPGTSSPFLVKLWGYTVGALTGVIGGGSVGVVANCGISDPVLEPPYVDGSVFAGTHAELGKKGVASLKRNAHAMHVESASENQKSVTASSRVVINPPQARAPSSRSFGRC